MSTSVRPEPSEAKGARVVVGLRARLVLAVLVALLLVVAVGTSAVALRVQRSLDDVDAARFAAQTRQLAVQVRYGVLAQSEALLAPTLASFAESPDLIQVQVEDDGGRVLATARGAAAADSDVPVSVEATVTSQGRAPGDEGGELDAFGLDDVAPRPLGVVRATYSTASTREVRERLQRDVMLAVVFGGAAGLVLVALLAQAAVRRLRRLAQAASRVAGGDLGGTVSERGSDELASLARDFNAMTQSLRQQRQALDEAAAALAQREALAAIGRANAVIAHELRNPLGIVLGAAEIVANPHKPAAARQEAASIVADEVQRLSQRLDQLLDYARPTASRPAPLPLLPLLQRATARAVLPGAAAHGCQLHLDVDAGLVVRCDAEQTEQIVLNLLQNAAQAGARGLWVSAAAHGDHIDVHIDDDGQGVAGAVVEQLFQPFVTTKQQGAGLGLSASRRMARESGGDLRFGGAGAHGGARFTLRCVRVREDRG